jgi:hypothetical protein
VLTATLAFGLPLSACSGSQPAQSTPVADALSPSFPPSLSVLPAAQPAKLLEADQASGLTSMPWLLTSISHDRRSIEVAYVAGDGYCTKPVGFRVQKLGQSVQVAALNRQNGDSACGNALVLRRAAVELPQALVAGVTLLHAPVARAWDNPNFFD